ncbi:glycogen debranching protein [Kitasatospora sp. Root187]|nr:glycogen debranching protein [Kitasatospora sp. Root107]KRB64094.1 glycogen debranching protein [Kitasatospora sp. Root187]
MSHAPMEAPPGPTELEVGPGRPQPLGATLDATGVNFAVYSEHATQVELLLFDRYDALAPSQVIRLDPDHHRSYHFWHCRVEGLTVGQTYAYRMDGPHHTKDSGSRFNPRKVLLDPYARANVNSLWERVRAIGPEDNCAYSMRSMVVDLDGYDWEGDEPLRTPLADSVIYEVHVGGLTASPTSRVTHPGTFTGVVEKIPYLKELGVTAVELLPVFDFDERQVLRTGPNGAPLHNYWGYDPFGFFAPHTGYCSDACECTHITEFRDMVKALHKAGIEVILDVVFNHTSEGNEHGPTISFRGQANETYYHLWPQDRRHYMDFTGCGNAINANHPAVAKFIIECLEYWVTEHHVDGFRFDLASELSRGAEGYEMDVPPVLWGIELSGILSETKIIAEPWDGGGLYQVGRFPGKRWSQWNGPYRDDIRRFVRGDGGLVGAVATRIGGSRDLFSKSGELPTNSVNFITCHDGFTLNDLVSYNEKHNHANGESNADGSHENFSWNGGVEGPTDAFDIERLRIRQIKNHVALLMLSRGVPMILAGDEFRNSQDGNNNAYCQGNPIAWLDWEQSEKNTETRHFFQEMISFRKRTRAVREPHFFSGRRNDRDLPDVTWHGTRLEQPGWEDSDARVLAFTLAGFGGEPDTHVILNMFHFGLDFELPRITGHQWARTVDTAFEGPADILPPGTEEPVTGHIYHAHGRSVVVLTSLPHDGGIHR